MSDSEPAAETAAPEPRPPPSYTRTVIIALAVFLFDAFVGGQGFSFVFVLIFVSPILLIRVLMAWKDPPLRNRRFASIPIYLAATFAATLVVQADAKGARARAQQVIAACEDFRKANGAYPKTLDELVPGHLPAIPPARQRGTMTRPIFIYEVAGPNYFLKGTNVHVLIYTVIPPVGKAFYVFEEQRWGFYD